MDEKKKPEPRFNIDKQKIFRLLPFVLGAVVIVILCFGVNSFATSVGSGVGKASGAVVGAAVGSANGIKDGVTEGIAAGEEEGLSAEDTTVELGQSIRSVGKLEVLAAGVTLENINKIGKAYMGLYVIQGDAVFTVDLSDTSIVYSDDGTTISVLIPEPEIELYLDQSSTEKLAEVQNFSLTVSAEDGLREYLNSMAKTKGKTEEYLSNYSDLMQIAEDAAISQVRQLASRVNTGNRSVTVKFKAD